MADSIEQKLITRALAVAAAINGTGSYQTTLGTTINEAGATVQSIADSRPNWDQNELPALSIFQGEVEVEGIDDEANQVLRKMLLVFRGALERGTDASTARKFLADIQRVIRAAGDKWVVSNVQLAHHTEESKHAIEITEDTYEITGVEQQIFIYYVGNHMDLET